MTINPRNGGEWLQPLQIIEADAHELEGHLFDQEAELLIATTSRALTTLERPADIVELGSFHGKATVILGLVAKAINPSRRCMPLIRTMAYFR